MGSVTDIAVAPLYVDVQMTEGKIFNENISKGHSAFVYVVKGELIVEGSASNTTVSAESLAVLADGEEINIKAKNETQFLLIAGKPIKEPVARYGPFVMNTEEEIRQAYLDYQSGLFGRLNEEG